MEPSETTPTSETEKLSKTVDPKRKKTIVWVIFIIILGAGLITYFYSVGHSKVAILKGKNNSLSVQAANLRQQIQKQDNVNDGTVPANSVYKDPAGGIGMVNGAVIFTLPKDWVRQPVTGCMGGSVGSDVTCYDIASIAPKALVDSKGAASWSASVAVYAYASSDGSARSWYEKKYDGTPIANYNTPVGISINEASIGDYSALSYERVYGPLDNPDQDQGFYVVVHGMYAVVVTATLKDVQTYQGTQPVFDYRSTYGLDLTHFIQSVKFKD